MSGDSKEKLAEEEEVIEWLADLYTEKWFKAMERKGKKVTPEGIKRYRENAKVMARIKILTMKEKGLI